MSIAVDHKVGSTHGSNDYLSFARAHGSIDALDGLRTIAISLVLLRHAMSALHDRVGSAFEFGGWSFATPMLNGWMGVDLFFVLSGFLIGSHLIRRRGNFTSQTLGAYFGSRALRIVPTYFCVLFLVAFGFFPLYQPVATDIGPALLWHMAFLQDYLPSNFIVAFWSLGVEEKFYIVAPFLVLGIARIASTRKRLILLSALAFAPMVLRGVTLGFIDFDFSYRAYFETFRSPFHLTFDGLLIGVVCAEIFANHPLRQRLTKEAMPMLLIGTAIIAVHLLPFNLMDQIGLYDVIFQPFVLSLGFGMILLACALLNPKKGILTSRFSLIGARLSYSLYLVHMALIPMAMVPALMSGTEGAVFFMIFFVAYLALSIAVSWAIHFAVEKPFLMLKSRWF